MPQRNWRGEQMLTAGDLERHPDAPLKRSRSTWGRYLVEGIEVDGVIRMIPQRDIQGATYTSIEAIWEVIGDAHEAHLPGERCGT